MFTACLPNALILWQHHTLWFVTVGTIFIKADFIWGHGCSACSHHKANKDEKKKKKKQGLIAICFHIHHNASKYNILKLEVMFNNNTQTQCSFYWFPTNRIKPSKLPCLAASIMKLVSVGEKNLYAISSTWTFTFVTFTKQRGTLSRITWCKKDRNIR